MPIAEGVEEFAGRPARFGPGPDAAGCAGGNPVSDRSPMWTVPEAWTISVTALMSVVWPAPLGPMRAVIWPGSAFMSHRCWPHAPTGWVARSGHLGTLSRQAQRE